MLSQCIQWIDKLYTADSFCIYVMYVKSSGTYQQHFNHCLDTHSLQHAGLQSSPPYYHATDETYDESKKKTSEKESHPEKKQISSCR